MKSKIESALPYAPLALLALLASCSTFGFSPGRFDVRGMVYDFENRPVAKYEVSLDGKAKAVTDVTGRYVLPLVSPGRYRLTGEGKCFERYEAPAEILSGNDVQYLRVVSAEELLELADGALSRGDLDRAAEYVSRAEKTGSESPLIPFYSAVTLFRKGKPGDALAVLESLAAKGFDDPWVEAMAGDMRALAQGENDVDE